MRAGGLGARSPICRMLQAACTALCATHQHHTAHTRPPASSAARTHAPPPPAAQVPDVAQFIADHRMQVPMGKPRLLEVGLPATVEHKRTNIAK